MKGFCGRVSAKGHKQRAEARQREGPEFLGIPVLPPPRLAPFMEWRFSTNRRTTILQGGTSRRVHLSWTVIRVVLQRFSVALYGGACLSGLSGFCLDGLSVAFASGVPTVRGERGRAWVAAAV